MNTYSVCRNIFGQNVLIKSFMNIEKIMPDICDFELSQSQEPDVTFEIVDEKYNLNENGELSKLKQKTGDLEVYSDSVLFKTSQDFWMYVKEINNGTLHVICIYKAVLKRKIAKKLPLVYKLRSSEYETPDFAIARSFIFRCFYPIMQLKAISQDKSFIHGSTITKNNESIIMTGWGGSGKTSLSSCVLYEDKEYTFQSDDIAILSSNGETYFNPMVAHIYPYNLVGFKDFESKLSSLQSFSSRLHWKLKKKIKGMKGVRRRVRPVDLFQVNRGKAKLSKVIFFQRKDIPKTVISKIDSSTMSQLSLNVIMTEVSSLVSILSKFGSTYRSAGDESLPVKIFNVDIELYCKHQISIYENSLRNVDCFIVEVPIKHGPKELRRDTKDIL